jgi:hypothetical protein
MVAKIEKCYLLAKIEEKEKEKAKSIHLVHLICN